MIHFGLWDNFLNKLGLGTQSNATFQVQAAESSSSGEEDFDIYFTFKPWGRTIFGL